jgi:hypothetical protein
VETQLLEAIQLDLVLLHMVVEVVVELAVLMVVRAVAVVAVAHTVVLAVAQHKYQVVQVHIQDLLAALLQAVPQVEEVVEV